jgi:tetratricopeptide (TPR) repeat protein
MATAWNAGEIDEVMRLAEHAPAALRNDEAVLAFYGLAQQTANRHHDAVETFDRLTRMRPKASAYWNNLGVAGRHAGDFKTSEQALTRAKSLAPRDPEVHYNLGLLYLQQRRWTQARAALIRAVELAPQFVDARLEAAYACYVCCDSDGQEAMLQGVDGWPEQPAEQAVTLAAVLSAQGEPEAALHALARARLPDGPTSQALRLRIAAQRSALYERSNQLADARRELDQVPLAALDALPPDDISARVDGFSAHATLAMRDGRHTAALALYRQALDWAADPEHRASAGFGLAAAYDRERRYDDAWRALETAHAAQLEIAREVAPELLDAGNPPLAMAARSVSSDAFASWSTLDAPDAARSPVFVIGFPRSGTTLVEQMLDAQPGFQSMDERGHLRELIERMEAVGQHYPDALATLSQADADELRAIYWRLVGRVLPDLGQHQLVDKNPLNLLCLPMIVRLFPAARIILCVRHPYDVVLSCSMQSFRSPAFMVLCSSLERLARGYARALAHCCEHLEVFAPNWLELRYEDLTSEFDEQVARLGAFLGVADPSPMADFAEHARHKRFISTPSYAEVTAPVHRRSIGRWQAYRARFEPVLGILSPWIENFGYRV